MTGTRIRAAVITGPVLLALAGLAGSGLFWPTLIEPGPGLPAYRWAVGITGTGAVLTLAVAAARSTGRLRWSWAALTVLAACWTLGVLGALLGADDVLVWGWLRGAVFATGAAGLLVAPGVRRTAREWGLVLLDGWLVGGSVFVIGWVGLAHTGSLLTGATHRPMLYWVGVDLLFASVTAGLAMRTEPVTRVPVLLMVLVSLLTVTGDTTWGLTGRPEFPVVQWLIMMSALAAASTSHRLDLWQSAWRRPTSPGLLRWSQVAVVPGLLAALTRAGDPVVAVVAASVILVMAAEMVLVGRQNSDLWEALRTQARRLDQVVRDSRDAIVQVDRHGVVDFANDAVDEVLGWSPRALIGRRVTDVVDATDLPSIRDRVRRLDAGCPSFRVTARFRHQDGSRRCLEATVSRRSGEAPGYTLLARDVSDQVLLQSELRRLATTDTLTGLQNRHAFLTLLTERLLTGGETTVLFIDLDGFKAVNDVHGHSAGDRVLQEVADVLRCGTAPDDVAARLGGDEFAVLIADTGAGHADAGAGHADAGAGHAERLAARLAERLRRMPSEPARRISASIGVATAVGGTAESLLGNADLAMYAAKAAGGGRRVVYESSPPGPRAPVRASSAVRTSNQRIARTGDALPVGPAGLEPTTPAV